MHLQSLATYMQVSYMQLTCTSKNDVEKKKKVVSGLIWIIYSMGNMGNLICTPLSHCANHLW